MLYIIVQCARIPLHIDAHAVYTELEANAMISKERRVDLTKTLVKKLNKLITEQYTSNSALCKATGIHRNTISRLVNGKLQYIDNRTYAALAGSLKGL